MSAAPSAFDARVRFLTELGRRLHVAGVTAARLEGAIRATAQAIGVSAQVWSTPTGLLLSLGEADALHGTQQTRVLRLEPGDVDLSTLVQLDEIADAVIKGTTGIDEAWRRLQALDRPVATAQQLLAVAAFGLAGAAVAGLLRTGWLDIAVAGVLGLVVGWLALLSAPRPNLGAAFEAVAALLVTMVAAAFAHFVAPISMQTVTVAALIVLMPGLTLTTAVTELATQQLASGTARLAGATTTLLKLTFGSVAGAQLVRAIGWTPQQAAPVELPAAVEVVAIVAASASFAVLFKAARRDALLVMGAAALGYVLTRVASQFTGGLDSTFAGAVFFSSLVTTALSNLYGRLAGRPGALVRVPGIMLLVPGSVGFRALGFVMERDYTLGFDTLVAVLSAVLALVAGVLFGALVVPPRRYL